MTPAGYDSGGRELGVGAQLWLWNQTHKLGRASGASGGFTLPNGAIRAPDASWISKQRWDALGRDEQRRFPHISPDFVVEVVSPSDELASACEKMAEYMAQGVRLGWLIDPESETVEVYRVGRPVEILVKPASLSGEEVLPAFVLDLSDILFDDGPS